jgi:hypothetical protein
MATTTAHDKYMEMLIEKVRGDRYPSGELMDRIEAGLASREHVETYYEVLMEKVKRDRYPSKQMLDRVERLTALGRG